MTGTPKIPHGDLTTEPMASPMASMAIEFDWLCIDMMIPHHASIIAMAQAAEGGLTDPRLQTITRGIVKAQSAEIGELRGYREQFYGSPEPASMDPRMMGMMAQMMPGMGSMEEMTREMDATTQVAAICAAADPELAFIDLTIAHHTMAIAASDAARDQATHDEIRTFAERVIRDQQREIDELRMIRRKAAGSATPTGSPIAIRFSSFLIDYVRTGGERSPL